MTVEKPATGPEMFALLRARLYEEDLGAITGGAPAGPDDVVGVVMEMGMSSGTALVFGLRDGSASIYLSGGGGSLGGQGRPAINAAARRLVATAAGLLGRLSPAAVGPPPALPAPGRIRFSVFTGAGVRAAEAAEPELVAGSELTPLFRGAHEIITGFRLVEDARKPDERLYVNLLLTALARGHATSVVLAAGERLPDPAALTNDARDLEWFASTGLDVGAQSAEKVVNLLLEAAGFRRFHLRKTEGRIRTALESHDGASSSPVDFAVTKGRADDGRVRLELTRASA
jgi:hypothetical protein